MTRTEELIVALMEFDGEPIERFVRSLSGEDLMRFKLGLGLATAVTRREQLYREVHLNSTRLNQDAVRRLEERVRNAVIETMRETS